MIVEPERYIEAFAEAGADVISVHVEACAHLQRTLAEIRRLGKRAGVVLNPHTPEDSGASTCSSDVDLILVMSVNPGFGGQRFLPSALPKIAALRAMIDRAGARRGSRGRWRRVRRHCPLGRRRGSQRARRGIGGLRPPRPRARPSPASGEPREPEMRAPLWTLLFALAGCAPPQKPAPPPEAPLQSLSAPGPADAGAAEGTQPTADSVVADALAGVSRMRQLEARGKVKGRSVSRAEMVDYVRKQLKEEIPERVLRAQTELLYVLGTVPADFDYEKSLLELMGSQLAGFYDPKTKAMHLARDLPSLELDATLAHELVHALQDQHYDLEKLIKYREDATDEQSAIHALAEGDATSLMLDHVLIPRGRSAIDVSDDLISMEARGSIEMASDAAGVPSVMKRSVIAPYVDGVVFVHWARRRGGWPNVDAIWRDPPKTTEQLLHPEKLLAKELAESIAVPEAPAGGPSELIYRDVMGEQSVRILFEEWMPRRAAVEGASDWAGDRVAMFQDGERFALGWHLRYDSEKVAQRGFEAFARGVLRAPDAKPDAFVSPEQARAATKPGALCRDRSGAGPFAVMRQGRDLALVAGPYERKAGGPRGSGSCVKALAWAKRIVAQR